MIDFTAVDLLQIVQWESSQQKEVAFLVWKISLRLSNSSFPAGPAAAAAAAAIDMDKRKLLPKRPRLDGAVRTGPLNGIKS